MSSVHCVPACLLRDRWASLLAIVQTSSVQGSSVFLSPCSVLAKSLTEVVAFAWAKLWAFLTACSPETWYFHSSSSGQNKCVLCVDTACLLIGASPCLGPVELGWDLARKKTGLVF